MGFCQSGETAGLFPKVERSVGGRESVGGPQRAAAELSLPACVCVSPQSPPICFVTVRITTHHFRCSFKIKIKIKNPLVHLVCEYTFYSTDVV